MLSFIWSLIIGGLIGWAAGAITGKGVPFGIIGNIVAGFIGANLGTAIFGSWGPSLGGFAILPALVGAIILILIVSVLLRAIRK
ncbi:GlsB/YeaQ/YmgE family stress response membrane protein [Alkalicoccobacillus porphyridii]|uniref:GlsB/YeaQ/YmgE family stress response membrane protein n=1 Tax=Alkalicoccobacillus porphyridii TaxID=2597270 RepID=A0A554A0W7_9BACI|nr:GlsB/YeaQ/YmgE family stress response membrane protein [Alkalicoccobacillus porphyridii]TSB47334.1 GlsB/YeaQ/YmgE family stress response membrane protein [Alkalicoccobacillus porphyridii]